MQRHLLLALLAALGLTQCAKSPSKANWSDHKQSALYVTSQTDHPTDQACLLANVLATPAHQADAKLLLTQVPINQPCAWLARGKLALLEQKPATAAKYFNLVQQTDNLDDYLRSRHLLGFALQAQNQWRSALNIWAQVSSMLTPSQQEQYNLGLWQLLQSTPTATLQNIQSNNTQVNGWLALALTTTVNEIQTWQTKYPHHPGQQLIKQPLLDQSMPNLLVLALPKQGANVEASRAIQRGLFAMHFQQPSGIKQIQWIDSNIENWTKQLPDTPVTIIGLLTQKDVNDIAQDRPSAKVLNLQSTDAMTQPNQYEFDQSTATQGLQITQYLAKSGYQNPLIISQQDHVDQPLAASVVANWPYHQPVSWYFLPQSSTMDHQQAIQKLLQIDESQDRIDQIKATFDAPLIAKPHQSHAFDMTLVTGNNHFIQETRAIFNFNNAASLPVFATHLLVAKQTASLHDFSHINYFDIDHQALDLPAGQSADAQVIKSLKQLYPKHFIAYQADYLKGINAYRIIQRLPFLQNFNAWTCMGINGSIHNHHHQITQPITVWHQKGSIDQIKALPPWQIWQLPPH
jgi:hypothetical protein